MKYLLYIFIFTSTINCYSQKIDSNHKRSSLSYTECEYLYEKNKKKLRSDPIDNFKNSFNSWPLLDINDSLMTILNCGVTLREKNNQRSNIVEKTLLSFTENVYTSLSKRKKLKNHINAYKLADMILLNIPSEEAFAIGMKYFEVSKDDDFYQFADDYGVRNLSLTAFHSVLLPMMSEKSRVYYKKLYEDKYLEYTINTLEEDNFFKNFHLQFYPIIKADWEAGKIKLKKE